VTPRVATVESRVTAVASRVAVPDRRRSRSRAMHFEWLELDRLTPELVAQWRALGLAASTPNVYLMPDFMLPAIRYLEADKAPRVAVLWDGERRTLLALGVFNCVAPSWRFPISRLSAVKSKHSFQAGVLLRAGIGTHAVDRFVDGLFGASSALRFNELREDALIYRQLQDSAERLGLSWFVDRRYPRASLELDDHSAWRDHISVSRHRRLHRARRKLATLGRLEFRIVAGSDICARHADAFLRLESNGWKCKTALLARIEDTRFFREMTHHGEELGLFFCELLLDDKVIASTTNFCVNHHGFAFKTGYDSTYRHLCPGFLVEYAFLESLEEGGVPAGLREIESGAEAGSFLDELWPKRIPIVSGHLVAGKLPTIYARVRQRLKPPDVVAMPEPARGAVGRHAARHVKRATAQ
jgi:CelD/BcsL family acetyltransferase involved in cellulose biosynthesis